MKKYFVLLLVILLASCKTKAVLATAPTSTVLSSEKIIENHYNNKSDFNTINIKANAKYDSEKLSQNVTADIKIKKNEKIAVSIRYLGITMAKALITPTSVQYYEKLGGKYFEGDYQALSQWLGTDLDFNKVQNLLTGNALDDLHKGKYEVSIEESLYKLSDKTDTQTNKNFFLEAENFLVKKQEINQPEQQRGLQIVYSEYKKFDPMTIPLLLVIDAFQNDKKTNIEIEYKNIIFNEELSFPYSVPEGYERIYIDKTK